jgi:hypothetical protein
MDNWANSLFIKKRTGITLEFQFINSVLNPTVFVVLMLQLWRNVKRLINLEEASKKLLPFKVEFWKKELETLVKLTLNNDADVFKKVE